VGVDEDGGVRATLQVDVGPQRFPVRDGDVVEYFLYTRSYGSFL